MLLALDVGNTNILLGVFRDGVLVDTWRVSTERGRTGDEHGVLFAQLLQTAGLRLEDVEDTVVSSVVPPLRPALRRFAARFLRREALFVGEDLRPELPIRYTPPAAVGADRLVGAVAVLKKYGGPAVVVDFGTATTFDAISADGEYLGGAIAPGVGISLEALFRTAAHLPRIEVVRPPRAIGSSTVESMQSGAYYGFIGQAEGLVRRFRAELGPGTTVVATGGLAELVGGETDVFDHVEPNLVLDGLHLLYRLHQERRG